MLAKRKCTCATVKGNQCSINARAKKMYCGLHLPCKRKWINSPAYKRSINAPQASGQPLKCFDFILLSDENAKTYLQEDPDNTIVIADGEAFCYTHKKIADTLRPKERMYPCKTDTDIIKKDMSHEGFAMVQLRDAVIVDIHSLQSALNQKGRVIKLTKSGYVPRLVSSGVLTHKHGASVGGKHCQLSSGAMSYAAHISDE